MSGEYDRLRQLLLQQESERMDALQSDLQRTTSQFERISDQLADEIERTGEDGTPSRLARALAENTADSLEMAVKRKPQTVVNAVYPVIGPAIRRSLKDALRQIADDLDRGLSDALSPRALWWRLEAMRSGVPYAQVVLRHTARYRVEHLFLVRPDSGLLLGHVTAAGLPELDADAVAGMFTAINQFVHESVAADQPQAGGIGSAEVGEYQLEVSDGPQARLVAFVRGVPGGGFGDRLDELNEELHAEYGTRLIEEGGEDEPLLLQTHLDFLNARPQAEQPPKRRLFFWAVLALLGLALLAWLLLGWRWSAEVEDIGAEFGTMPGLVVSKLESTGRNKLRVEGLYDPLAPDPKQWLAEQHPQVKADWALRPYVSLEPTLIRRRVAQGLGLPEATVGEPDAQGVVRLQGSVPFPVWYRARQTPLSLPGMSSLEFSALSYPNKSRVDALVAEIETIGIPFVSGRAEPEGDWQPQLATLVDKARALERFGADNGIAFHFQTSGTTDEAGTLDQNRSLRQQRAEWLASRLAAQLHPPSTIVIDHDAVFSVAAHNRYRLARATTSPYPAPAAATPGGGR
ncbi:hypothetical protein [Pseudoxanthomonas kalamensis]|uniref:hypothetical protein n=1 Tax=Pseudoxanthomonas kalamensis TaxID=289483 RepID=UPI001390BB09|nr:hypothetical protein [Pseudoxanthomonas kalamensis]